MRRLIPPRSEPFADNQRIARFVWLFVAMLVLSVPLGVLPAVHYVRLLVSGAALYQLVRMRGRLHWAAKWFWLPLWLIVASGVADDSTNPLGPIIMIGLGLSLARYLVPWVTSASGRLLALLPALGGLGLLFPALVPSALEYTGRLSAHGRLDRALFGLCYTLVALAGVVALRELGQRWILRARIRTKLVVSYAIVALLPALLVAVFVALSAWVRAGQNIAAGVGPHLAATSAAHDWMESVRTRVRPDPGALDAAARAIAPTLTAHSVTGVLCERPTGRRWSTRVLFTSGDAAPVPALAPVSDSGLAQGLAAIDRRFYWMESAAWVQAGDSLVLYTIEPVTEERLGGYAAAAHADIQLATATVEDPSITIDLSSKDPLVIAAQADSLSALRGRRSRVEREAMRDSLARAAGATILGAGRYTRSVSPFPAGGSMLKCVAWDAQQARWITPGVAILARPRLADVLFPSFTGNDPLGKFFAWVLLSLGVTLLVANMIAVAWGGRIARLITGGAATLRTAASAIGSGDFSTRVSVPTRDEFGELADAFNGMARGLEEGRAAMVEREHLRRELDLARQIQTRLLPGEPPVYPRLEIAATNAMSQQVGGDYYDFVQLADGRLGLCVADVSGHGVAAALLMSNVKAALVSSAAIETTPEGITARVNRMLCDAIESGKFVTFFFAALDPRSLRMEYVNAGHPAPMLVRAGGEVERLDRGGVILGVLPGAEFERGAVTLDAGDLLTLFTDGLDEALDANDQLYGQDRVEATLRASRAHHAADVIETLLSDVRAHEGARGASDDLTLMVVRVAAA